MKASPDELRQRGLARFAAWWFFGLAAALLLMIYQLVYRYGGSQPHYAQLLWLTGVGVLVAVALGLWSKHRWGLNSARFICTLMVVIGVLMMVGAMTSYRFWDSSRGISHVRTLAIGLSMLGLFGIPLPVLWHPDVRTNLPSRLEMMRERMRAARDGDNEVVVPPPDEPAE
ncbi:MAG TPA: hypothetical protein VMZ92_04005 [Planctomycetota bacterium]|nr:hypothetical protein [Planctomycetota bacterium]